ncbi:MAG TPA: transcriptional regulator [Marmoricola sp.]|nr:transcriptional regulator [Marmoricola sp.]
MKPIFDPLIHEPNRLQICGLLSGLTEAEFAVIRESLGVADSVTSKHLKALEEAGYVTTSKRTLSGSRPRTWVRLTRAGRRAFAGHVAELQRLAQLSTAAVTAD